MATTHATDNERETPLLITNTIIPIIIYNNHIIITA